MASKFSALPFVFFTLALGASITALPVASIAADRGTIRLAQTDPDTADDPQSAAGLLLRVDKLENRIRSMTGQIEQLQYENKRLADDLRKMQQDVDFRFQDLGHANPQPGSPAPRPVPMKRGDNDLGTGEASMATASVVPAAKPDVSARPALAAPAPDNSAELDGTLPPDAGATVIPAPPGAPALAKPLRRGDAFDPAADPKAPGAPRPLGTTPPSAPLTVTASPRPNVAEPPHAPLDLIPGQTAALARPVPSPAAPLPDAEPGAAAALPGSASVASLVPGGTRSEYETDYGLYKSGQYDAAATAFTSFLVKYPRDRLLPDATYFLGESYARLGRHREAAEQFLRLTTDFTRSNRAPDALLRLGIALNNLGAKEQACATYQEVDRKFPTASADVRASVERELKRARC